MDYTKYYRGNYTAIDYLDARLNKIMQRVIFLNPKKVLDIGCADGFLVSEMKKHVDASFYGVDVYDNSEGLGKNYKKADITKKIPYKGNSFDCVILGEVIEHVPDPDNLIKEIRRILKKDGYLIISTPNLASWANRLLLLAGIQPLYTETSSDANLGRFFKALGQGNKVQGHLKIFTYKSLEEILEKCGFSIVNKSGAPFFFPFPISLIDRLFSHTVPLASDLVYVAKLDES